MEIKRTAADDEMCREVCKACETMHALECPYTQARWMRQGWARADQFTVATPQEIRESKAA